MIKEVFYRLETFKEEESQSSTTYLVKPISEWLVKEKGSVFLFSDTSVQKIEFFWGDKKIQEFSSLSTFLGAQYAYLVGDINFSIFSFEEPRIKLYFSIPPVEVGFYLNYSLAPNYIINIYEPPFRPC